MIMNVSTWQKALVSDKSSIREAIQCLDSSAFQIALVVADDKTLLGTITDGDIRRAIIKSTSMDHIITDIMNPKPLVSPPNLGKKAALQLMQANKIQQLPIVDAEGKVCGLHLMEDLVSPPELPNIMVIMAGGKGTRLRPFTQQCPKPMLPIGGKPMLEHILMRAKAEGVSNFILAINYLGEKIEEYFKDGAAWGISISYLRENEPLGTAGALSLLASEPEHPIIVCNGDVLTDIHYCDLLDFHAQNNATATMAVTRYEWQNPFGVVKTNGIEITGFEEKPISRSNVNAGIYILSPKALEHLESSQACDMPNLFTLIKASQGKVIAYPMHEPWLDIGRPDDLALAREHNIEEN